MRLSDMKVGMRIGLGFAAVLLMSGLLGLLSISRLGLIQASVSDLASNWMPSIKAISEIDDKVQSIRRLELRMCLLETVSEVQSVMETIKSTREKDLPKLISVYVPLIASPEEEAAWNAAKAKIDAYLAVQDRLIEQRKAGNRAEYQATVVGDSLKTVDEASSALAKVVSINEGGAAASYAEAKSTYDSVRLTLMVLLALQLVAGGLVAMFLTRNTVDPLQRMVSVAERVAGGDLGVDVDTSRRDEFGRLALALEDMRQSLNRSIGTVRSSAESIALSSSEVAAGSSDLSARTEQMASSLEETSATMQTLSETVRQNADATRQATGLARDASQVAEQGGAVVGRVVGTMEEINTSSRKISDIIGVIDGIAFQTNILALNAAVEAARAGEQGRGFAVVAGEVRSLAQRSAEAAREIKSLIGTSVDKVDAGTRLVAEAGQTMQELVQAVQRVSHIIEDISRATQEQSVSLSEVGQAVNRLDEVTQQNAALVEQSSAAAESLRDQAAQLSAAVSGFKTA
ncbi:MCP four helix bundle domain-containing protein [Mitsuaria sp. WAJ17]|uniref:methyl-accepting chemotaxis protein n=1 Tax=Mitsuaria sp. WAJ17 TaxID=2761452 RepID=UPI0016049EE8|nr:methyl-accepting chemotaxis protein [Mitsuaria sp. WAJ17]MBB2485088.1 MCP four helix bundle domain-containing protein [Mitsuaria sp. WAJ17]